MGEPVGAGEGGGVGAWGADVGMVDGIPAAGAEGADKAAATRASVARLELGAM